VSRQTTEVTDVTRQTTDVTDVTRQTTEVTDVTRQTPEVTDVITQTTKVKIGSDESHFSSSLIVRDTVTRQCPQITTFEERVEPKRRNRTEVLLLTSLTPYH